MSELLRSLTMLNGIPANEKQVRQFFVEQVKEFGPVTYDNLGSAIVEKVGDSEGPKIMVAGHMDEIGFIVTEITKEGYVKFIPAGGWWGHVVLSQQFTITTRSKAEIHAVVGSKPPHILGVEERAKVVDLKDMYLDLGLSSKEEVIALGVQVGDMVTPFIEFRKMANPKYLLAKAFDNRIGVALAIEVLKNLQGVAHPNRYFGVATVQEEVGLRGAGTAAYKVSPDIGIALDVTIAHDYPGGTKETEMGKGPCIMIYDSSMVGHVGLREFTVAMCEELKIPYQLSYLRQGGTDAGKMHMNQSGAPSIAICIASRYIHSHTSMIHQDDYDNAVKIVTELVKRLDRATVDAITYE
ncbi:MAG: M42 family metallopeptidase [Candidatus Izemoplasmatales bacterium]|jgi:putative aminopeptidase FrvX|nr:M42 family metallopeptidase [bacterium]MDZ4196734.1 M42 family metallopeptidase [Candidatus Izemoplasmatales bacterium]